MSDSKSRFTGRATDYEKYRPLYPSGLLSLMYRKGILSSGGLVADIGSGTGISAQIFLDGGHEVWAVEPNVEMRTAAESHRGILPGFHSVPGTAENSGLKDHFMDLVFCAQAFHWFDFAKAAIEFRRILKPGKFVCIAWNERMTEGTGFDREYEQLLHKHSSQYAGVNHVRDWKPVFAEFFASGEYETDELPNSQMLDLDGLLGRTRSCSYMNFSEGEPDPAILSDLEDLYDKNQGNGFVQMNYRTTIYCGLPS